MTLNQRAIPEAAFRDKNAVEILRVWIAEKKMHCSMKVRMYRETTNIAEERAWGVILADIAKHAAQALEKGYAAEAPESLRRIRESFLAELSSPTSEAAGEFVERH